MYVLKIASSFVPSCDVNCGALGLKRRPVVKALDRYRALENVQTI